MSGATPIPKKLAGIEPFVLSDGIYDGSYRNSPVKALVRVTIKDKNITSIELIEHKTRKGEKAGIIIPKRIIKEQSTKVDSVTGAKISSVVIMNAVQDAINNAKKE
jgi:uncharacterized protein with FMN-binding domain